MLWNTERLLALGLVGNLYYIVLLPLGLAAAAFLFGVFRSYARYTGKALNGKLELGGPIVGFALVVIGGFYLPKPTPEAFSVTVMVHGENGSHDLVLRNSGVVWITLGTDLRQEKIGDKGQADFKNVPASFRGQEVPVSVEANGFELLKPKALYALGSGSVDVTVRRKAALLTGSVRDTAGRPVTTATVRVREVQVDADLAGRFKLTILGSDGSNEVMAEIAAPGFELWRGRLVPNGGDNAVQLRRTP